MQMKGRGSVSGKNNWIASKKLGLIVIFLNSLNRSRESTIKKDLGFGL